MFSLPLRLIPVTAQFAATIAGVTASSEDREAAPIPAAQFPPCPRVNSATRDFPRAIALLLLPARGHIAVETGPAARLPRAQSFLGMFSFVFPFYSRQNHRYYRGILDCFGIQEVSTGAQDFGRRYSYRP